MIDYLRTSWAPISFYGACAALGVLCAYASKRPALIDVSWVLLADWLAWNLTIGFWGYAHAPLLLPAQDAMFLGFVVWRTAGMGEPAARMVAYLFVVAIVAWLVFGLTGAQNSYTCYATANVLFLLQVVTAGASGAWWAYNARVASFPRRGRLRPDHGVGAHRLHSSHRTSREERSR